MSSSGLRQSTICEGRPTSGRQGFFGLFLLLAVPMLFCGACRLEKGPPLSPQQALGTFKLPEGFHIEIVAAEPEVRDPVAMAFDPQGRLFVVEMRDYPMQAEPNGKIKLLEDLDENGHFEKSTVFAESLHFPTSVMPWREGVLVATAPSVLYLSDTDGDNRADERRVILSGFNAYNPQLRVNGLLYGVDNWIYAAYPKVGPSWRNPERFGKPGEPIHFPDQAEVPAVDLHQLGMDFRFRPDPWKLEPAAGNSQFGNTFDARGNRFTLWNNSHIRHVVIEHRYLARNAYQGVASAMQFPSNHENQSTIFPATKNPIYIHESQLGMFTSACGNSVYTGGNFPDKYSGAYFVCEPVHNLIHSDILIPMGATFVAERALEEGEFLASTDSWFKPVFTTVGPDGGLYVVDYYRKYVEHPDYIPEGMEDRFDLREGEERGRIYRIVHETSRPTAKPRLMEATPGVLLRQLSNPNMWWRNTAQRLLVEREDQSVVPALRELAVSASSVEGRIHALWTLEGLGALGADLVLQALGDESPAVREQAIRLAEGELSDSVQKKLLSMIDEPEARVLFQLVCTLGLLPPEKSFRALRQIVSDRMEDPWFQIAALSTVSETATSWFRAISQERTFLEKASKGKREYLRRIASIIGARQKDREVAQILNSLEEEKDIWWRLSCIQGLAEGLKRGKKKQIRLPPAAQRILVELLQEPRLEIASAALDAARSIDLSGSRQLRASLSNAAEMAAKMETAVESRVHAVRWLGLDPTGSSIPLLKQLLNPHQPVKVRIAAANALWDRGDSGSPETFLEQWKTYPGSLREVVVGGFFDHPTYLPVLLDAIEDERVQPSTLSRGRIFQLLHSRDEQIRRRAEVLFADALKNDRSEIIERYRPALTAEGELERGRKVFKQHCSACHRIDGVGFDVGPDLLDLSGRRTKGFMLTAIIDPDASITPGYEEYLIQTRDGRTFSGVIAEDGPTAVTLRRREGDANTLLRTNIVEVRGSTVSAMPEGLEEEIGIQEMADLLEYLQNVGQSVHSR